MTLLIRGFSIAFLLVVGCTSAASAQERLESVPQGQPLRVTSELLPRPFTGAFRGISGDSLWLVGKRNLLVGLPLARVQQIEVWRPDRRTGALVGAVSGALALTISFFIYGHSRGGFLDCGDCPLTDDLGFAALLGVPIGGLAGAGVGALIGASEWEVVQISPTLERSGSAGRALGVRFRMRAPLGF